MDTDLKLAIINRIESILPEKEDMLREARIKMKDRFFFPSFNMGAYYVKVLVLKELEKLLEEDIEDLKKQLK